MEIRDILDKDFKVMVIRVFTELGRIEELNKNFNKEVEKVIKNESELNNT